MSYFIVGDIHGRLLRLNRVIKQIKNDINRKKDTIIFLGDYVDRGPHSYDVVEYLLKLSEEYCCIFIAGNHEELFLQYYNKSISFEEYKSTGGEATIKSYESICRPLLIPTSHFKILNSGKLFFEGEDFIAVHAGLNPEMDDPRKTSADEKLWIRARFYRAHKKWEKTVIFGHTPTQMMGKEIGEPHVDSMRNIIGIDTGCGFSEGRLTCIKWPEKNFYHSN